MKFLRAGIDVISAPVGVHAFIADKCPTDQERNCEWNERNGNPILPSRSIQEIRLGCRCASFDIRRVAFQ